MQSLPLAKKTDTDKSRVSLLDLAGDVIIWIALFNPGAFHGLALCHPRFARILRRPFVQALAKDRFTLHFTFVQTKAPFYAVTVKHLPDRTLRNVRHCDKDTGIVRVEAKFVDGLRHGPEKRYDKEGRLERVINYSNGVRNGPDIVYNTDGLAINTTKWVDNDIWESREFWVGDMQFKERYTNGHLRKKYLLIEGKLVQITRFRVEDPIPPQNNNTTTDNSPKYCDERATELAARRDWSLDWVEPDKSRSIPTTKLVHHGKQVSFWPNGNIESVYEFKNGYIHGKDITYNQDGTLATYCEYKHSRRHGSSITYYPNGLPSHVDMYENDVPVGVWLEYYECGSIKCMHNRTTGQYIEYDTNGNIVDGAKTKGETN